MAVLPKAAVKEIEERVDELFDNVKLRFLGPQSVPKRLYIGFRRDTSLPGIYERGVIEEGGIPDRERLEQLLNTASNYIESLRLRAKARVVDSVSSFLIDSKGWTKRELETKLGGELSDLFASIKTDLHRIIDTESQRARALGQLEGIVKVNASQGIEDPVVYFVTVRDGDRCDECTRLHVLEDKKTPRVWRLSELGNGFHKRGDPQPKVGGLHPHCRCSLTTLMPGFGFDGGGYVTWKGDSHDEYEAQRG